MAYLLSLYLRESGCKKSVYYFSFLLGAMGCIFCNVLHVGVLPKFVCWSSMPQCDGMRRCCLWDMVKLWDMGLWGWKPHDEISTLIKSKRTELSLHHVMTQQECSHQQARKRALTGNQPCWHPDCRLPSLQNQYEN